MTVWNCAKGVDFKLRCSTFVLSSLVLIPSNSNIMSQQLQLFAETTSMPQNVFLDVPLSDTSSDTGYDPLLEQTRQLFQHDGSNAELMTQVMNAINALNEICEQPKV